MLDDAASSFNIKSGSSFDASGGPADNRMAESLRTARKISNDISEAEALIASRFAGKKMSSAYQTSLAMNGSLAALDPHSTFFPTKEWQELLSDQESEYSGIGVTLSEYGSTKETAATYILAVAPGSPAERAGFAYGDKIAAIDGQSVKGIAGSQIREKLLGQPGTKVIVSVERGAVAQRISAEMKRTKLHQQSIQDAYMLRPGIGYIDLTEGFSAGTAKEFDDSLAALKSEGLNGLVIDLRGNRGGIVDQAVRIAGRFLPAGRLILDQRGRGRWDNREWRSENTNPDTTPLILLVDEHTASAAEIVVAALQDWDRAVVIGERTFGKGLVQSVLDMPDMTGVTLTTARYLTPSGRSIQRDYKRMGQYDYFLHSPTSEMIDSPYFEAKTLLGRRVTGGNGITPDLILRDSQIRKYQPAVFERAFFDVRSMSAQTRSQISKPFRNGNSAYNERLEYELSLATRGIKAARRTLISNDPATALAFAEIQHAKNIAAESLRSKVSDIN